MVQIAKKDVKEVEGSGVLEIICNEGKLEIGGQIICTELLNGEICCIVPRGSVKKGLSDWDSYNTKWDIMIVVWDYEKDVVRIMYKTSSEKTKRAMKSLVFWLSMSERWGWIRNCALVRNMRNFFDSLEEVHQVNTMLAERG